MDYKAPKTLYKNNVKRSMAYKLFKDYMKAGKSIKEIIAIQSVRKLEQKDSTAPVYAFLNLLISDHNMNPMDAFRQVFPADEVVIIESFPPHKMHEGFERVANMALKKQELKSLFTSSLVLPYMSGFFGIITLYVLLSANYANYSQYITDDAMWPPMAIPFLFLHSVFVENVFLTLGAVVVFTLWVNLFSLKATHHGHRKFFDWLPPWSVQKSIQSSSFLVALGIVIGQRESFVSAVEKIYSVSPVYIRSYLRLVMDRLNQNATVSQALDVGMLDKDTMNYIDDFSESDSFHQILTDVGDDNIENLKKKMEGISLMIGAVVIMSTLTVNAYVTAVGYQLQDVIKASFS